MVELNPAQWFMLIQVLTCMGGGIGFAMINQPWAGGVWVFYSLANVCWFMIAGGRQ